MLSTILAVISGSLKANKSKNEAYYLDTAYDILDRLMELI